MPSKPPQTTGKANTKNSQSDPASQSGVISHAISDINQEFKERAVQQKSRELGISYIDLSLVPINPDILSVVSEEDALKAKVMPFFRVGQKLRIALTDVENDETKRVIESLKKSGFVLNLNLCSEESLSRAHQMYKSHNPQEKEIITEVKEENVANIEAAISSLEEIPEILEKMKGDEALNVLHQQVLRMGMSDMHLEPQQKEYRVRARIDGVLTTLFSLPSEGNSVESLIRQIKYNARLKLNIVNVPQDGQYFFRAKDRLIDVRVSVLPTKRGESVVMRFLDPKKGIVELSDLGLSDFLKSRLETALESPNGLVLVTGPTGSGKTTSLYSALQKINDPGKKIITLEDPVEYHLEGILQSQVNEENGYTFVSGLRALLRQDPDVVMIGEIRDLETAETAVQASLTGHLVLSTLHTNSAIDALPRLLNMGVKNYILAPAIRAVVAQRLVRKVCEKCRKEREMGKTEKEEIFATLKQMTDRGDKIPEVTPHVKEAKGCDACSQSGFRGEMAIGEILVIDETLESAIFENASAPELKKLAEKNGFRTMWEEGILAVIDGKTTLTELRRAVGR